MGGFHIALDYLAVIGKMFRDSGLLDLIIESDIYGCSTASHLLKGKTYNRGVRCHKLVMEALSRIQYQELCEQPEMIYIFPVRRVSQNTSVTASWLWRQYLRI